MESLPQSGVPDTIAYVSEQMGHANIQLTVKRYGHLQPGANRHWMNALPGRDCELMQARPENNESHPKAAPFCPHLIAEDQAAGLAAGSGGG